VGDAAKAFLDSFPGSGGESNEYDQFLKAKRQFDEAIETFRQNKKDAEFSFI